MKRRKLNAGRADSIKTASLVVLILPFCKSAATECMQLQGDQIGRIFAY
jgi:hypothetical protein